MPAPTGQWHVNANGFKGTLTINADPAGHLTGSVDIDPGFSDQLVGLWSEAAQEIIFQRVLVRGGATHIQTYTGCLFTSKEPLFAGQGPPEPNPSFRLMTGTFDAVGTGAPPARHRFGWMARQNI
jgi:hypothetical protein